MANRPLTIVYFERIILATFALGVLQTYLGWNQLVQQTLASGRSISFLVFIDLITFGVLITLALLICRRRSRIAMWVSIGLFVLGLPLFFVILRSGLLAGSSLISLLQTVGQFAAYTLLFTRSAQRWLGKKDIGNELAETFS